MGLTIIRALAFMWLSVLAADILYLYYAGGWQEPIAIIRIAELAFLYACIPGGIVLAIIEIKKCRR